MVRPKSKREALRSINKTVHLNSEENAIIVRKAKKFGMSVSRYMCEASLTADESRLPKVRLSAIAAIRKIGINHNQIAHYLNSVMISGGSVNNTELLDHFKKIDTQLKEAITDLRIK